MCELSARMSRLGSDHLVFLTVFFDAFCEPCAPVQTCHCLRQDHLCPYMMHHAHHSDTLFLISEDDWRLKASEDVLPDRKLPKRGVWADPDEPHDSDDDWGCWLASGRVDPKQSGGGNIG